MDVMKRLKIENYKALIGMKVDDGVVVNVEEMDTQYGIRVDTSSDTMEIRLERIPSTEYGNTALVWELWCWGAPSKTNPIRRLLGLGNMDSIGRFGYHLDNLYREWKRS